MSSFELMYDGDSFIATVTTLDEDDNVVDITGATIEALMRNKDGVAGVAPTSTAIVNGPLGIFSCTFDAGDLLGDGHWTFAARLTIGTEQQTVVHTGVKVLPNILED